MGNELKKIPSPLRDIIEYNDSNFSYSISGPSKKDRKNASRKKSALATVLEILYSEHRYIASLLDTLELEADKLQPGKVPDFDLLFDIVDYLIYYPDKYHHPREDMLYAMLGKKSREFQSISKRLQRDHETLAVHNKGLYGELMQIVNGGTAQRAGLLKRIKRYIASYREHIEYESKEVFPLASGALTPTEQNRLQQRTRFVDDPLFGGETQYEYNRVARRLRARFDFAGQKMIQDELSFIENLTENIASRSERIALASKQLGELACRQSDRMINQQLGAVKSGLSSKNPLTVIKLPWLLARNQYDYFGQGLSEFWSIIKPKSIGDYADNRSAEEI